MKKIIYSILIFLYLNSIALAQTIDLVCTPDSEVNSSYQQEKIWIKFNKPKFFITLDLDKMKVKKLSFSKKREKYSNVGGVILEKGPVLDGKYKGYKFIKAGELIPNELYVYNLIEIIEINSGFGLLTTQYRLNNNQITSIEKNMNKFTYSEFEKARKEYENKNLEPINFFGGLEGLCE